MLLKNLFTLENLSADAPGAAKLQCSLKSGKPMLHGITDGSIDSSRLARMAAEAPQPTLTSAFSSTSPPLRRYTPYTPSSLSVSPSAHWPARTCCTSRSSVSVSVSFSDMSAAAHRPGVYHPSVRTEVLLPQVQLH
jgi:hypothetical protein